MLLLVMYIEIKNFITVSENPSKIFLQVCANLRTQSMLLLQIVI